MHPNHSQIMKSLATLLKKADPSPWILAIHEYLPKENMHVTLVDNLTSQAKDSPKTMVKIVGVEITELLLQREVKVI